MFIVRSATLLLLYFSMLMSAAPMAEPIPDDWVLKERVLLNDGTPAYTGCAIESASARQIAILRAEAGLARTRSTVVSGSEHLRSVSPKKDGEYHVSINETAASIVLPVSVLAEATTQADGERLICVLVVEIRNQ